MAEKFNILFVDDNPDNVKLALNILNQQSNYNVIFATSGEEAIKRVKERKFDIFILDILMEPMDGFELCKHFKSNKDTRDIPVIFLTVKDDEETIVKGFQTGAVDYIVKPFNANELLARVNTHLELKSYKDNLIKELELQDKLLIQQHKMATIGEMFEYIAHQWRQPLSVITLSSDSLIMMRELNKTDRDKEYKYLESIKNNAVYLSKTINDFREFLKNKEKKTFNIKDAFKKALSLILPVLNENNIEISENMDDMEIYGIENEFIQVIINLLNNSKDILIERDSKIKVIKTEAYKDNNQIVFKITDSGGGIYKEIISRIFDKYFTTKKHSDGTGVGLYMCREIIKKDFNGDITVANKEFVYKDTKCFGAEFTIIMRPNQE